MDKEKFLNEEDCKTINSAIDLLDFMSLLTDKEFYVVTDVTTYATINLESEHNIVNIIKERLEKIFQERGCYRVPKTEGLDALFGTAEIKSKLSD